MSHEASPVGGRLLTRPFLFFLVLFLAGAAMMAWRFASGLGATTGLNDGYPWGLWIAFDVVTGTALACGGYAIAMLVYILNKGRYHPLIRPAILTSALGYSLAGFSIILDVGRYWNLYKVLDFGKWNLNSVLLEVAVCVMAYVFVLWIELSPAFLEKWRDRGRGRLAKFAEKLLPVMDKVLIFVIALGILLPTMHQSSLGSVMLIAGAKLHGLWHTPLLPLLFLLSVITMGYGAVVIESHLAATYFGRKPEKKLLASLGTVIAIPLVLYIGIRVGDIMYRDRLDLVAAMDIKTVFFLIELALSGVALLLLVTPGWRDRAGTQFRVALLLIAAGVLYRFDTYLVAFDPGPGWSYFPSVPEILVTVGIVSLEILAYIFFVKRYPILAGGHADAPTTPPTR